MGVDYKFDLMLSEDGSGRGAALVAAVLKREEETEQQKQNGSSSWTKNLSFFNFSYMFLNPNNFLRFEL